MLTNLVLILDYLFCRFDAVINSIIYVFLINKKIIYNINQIKYKSNQYYNLIEFFHKKYREIEPFYIWSL